jgi:hypothetical protein
VRAGVSGERLDSLYPTKQKIAELNHTHDPERDQYHAAGLTLGTTHQDIEYGVRVSTFLYTTRHRQKSILNNGEKKDTTGDRLTILAPIIPITIILALLKITGLCLEERTGIPEMVQNHGATSSRSKLSNRHREDSRRPVVTQVLFLGFLQMNDQDEVGWRTTTSSTKSKEGVPNHQTADPLQGVMILVTGSGVSVKPQCSKPSPLHRDVEGKCKRLPANILQS